MIVIVDYGLGNLNSIRNQLKRLKLETIISRNIEDIRKATKLILPGVGHFKYGMNNLHEMGLIEPLTELVLHERVPILGICLGMQLFADFSEEGNVNGLGWIQGRVVKFTFPTKQQYKVPHIGWNSLIPVQESPLIDGIQPNSMFYFVHSYHFICSDQSNILTRSSYGIEFISSVNKGNIFGTQFHPEKSHSWGNALLENFINRV